MSWAGPYRPDLALREAAHAGADGGGVLRPHAGVGHDHRVGREALGVLLDQSPEVRRTGLLLALDQELQVDGGGGAAGGGQVCADPEGVEEHLALVVGGAPRVHPAVGDDRLERVGVPAVLAGRGLHVVVSVHQDGGRARLTGRPLGVDGRGARGLKDLGDREPGLPELGGEPVGTAPYVRVVVGLGRHGRDPQPLCEVAEEGGTVLLDVRAHRLGGGLDGAVRGLAHVLEPIRPGVVARPAVRSSDCARAGCPPAPRGPAAWPDGPSHLCVRRRTRPRPPPAGCPVARPRRPCRPPAGGGRRWLPVRSSSPRSRTWRRLRRRSLYTASIRPRTTRPARASWNGASMRNGVRVAYGVRSKASLRAARSRSSAMSASLSSAPGSSSGPSMGSGSSSNRDSTQAWNRVPRRAAGCGAARHGAGQVLGEAVGIGGEPQQLGRGEGGRHRHVTDGGAGPPEFGGERLQVAVPGVQGAAVLGGETRGGDRHGSGSGGVFAGAGAAAGGVFTGAGVGAGGAAGVLGPGVCDVGFAQRAEFGRNTVRRRGRALLGQQVPVVGQFGGIGGGRRTPRRPEGTGRPRKTPRRPEGTARPRKTRGRPAGTARPREVHPRKRVSSDAESLAAWAAAPVASGPGPARPRRGGATGTPGPGGAARRGSVADSCEGRVLGALGRLRPPKPRSRRGRPRSARAARAGRRRGRAGVFWLGPHQWPEPRSRERGRVNVT